MFLCSRWTHVCNSTVFATLMMRDIIEDLTCVHPSFVPLLGFCTVQKGKRIT